MLPKERWDSEGLILPLDSSRVADGVKVSNTPPGTILLVCCLYLKNKQNRDESIYRFHFPNAHSSQDWARLKAGTRNSIWLAHMGGRDPSPWAICCLPGHEALAGNWMGSRGLDPRYTMQDKEDTSSSHLTNCRTFTGFLLVSSTFCCSSHTTADRVNSKIHIYIYIFGSWF